MGTGNARVRDYHVKNGFYKVKSRDERSGRPFWFIMEPLYGGNGERFFYVKEPEPGKFELEGEFHCVYTAEHLTEYLKEIRENLQGVVIQYWFLDDEGRVRAKEISPQPVNYLHK
jgi:hypothetical protein